MHRNAPYRHSDQELTNDTAIPIVCCHEERFTDRIKLHLGLFGLLEMAVKRTNQVATGNERSIKEHIYQTN